MAKSEHYPDYRIYLLKMWAEEDELETEPVWRFSIKDPRTGKQYGFANFTALVNGLLEEVALAQESDQSTARPS